MSKNTLFNTRFWQDSYVADLTAIEKLLFAYFITSPSLSLTGIYEVPLKHVANDTGVKPDVVSKAITRFERDKKILYRDGWVCVVNYPKYQNFSGIKLETALQREIKSIPQKTLLFFVKSGYPIDTLSIPSMDMVMVMDKDMVMDMDKDKERERVEEGKKSVVVSRAGFGEMGGVKLTEEEYTKLCEKLSKPVADSLIEELDLYISSKGARYKSHYATVLGWARRRVNEHHARSISRGKGII